MAIPATHIKLGATAATLRPYMLDDPRNITQMLANPVAAKLGTGGSKYDDFTNWAYWVQEDWSAGAGRQSDSPGLLYGDLSTFMAGRLTLPMLLRPTSRYQQDVYTGSEVAPFGQYNAPLSVVGTVTIGSTQTYTRAVNEVYTKATNPNATRAWFYADATNCTSIRVSLVSSTAGGTVIETGLISNTYKRPGAQWFHLDFGGNTVLADYATTRYYLHIYPETAGETLLIPYAAKTTGVYRGLSFFANSAVVANYVTAQVSAADVSFFSIIDPDTDTLRGGSATSVSNLADMTMWNGVAWCWGDDFLYKANCYPTDLGEEHWNMQNASTSPAITDAVNNPSIAPDMQAFEHLYITWGTKLYKIVYTTDYTMSEVGTDLPSTLLYSYNGYLYRSYANDLYYTGDGSTWTGPIQFGADGYSIRGMAGMDGRLYVATDEALYYLGVGDLVVGVTPFPTVTSDNGKSMVTHQNSVYMTMGNRIWQFSETGAMQDVWLENGVEMPEGSIGSINSLASTHMGLMASVNPGNSGQSPSVWVLGSEGWHCLALLPPAGGAGKILQDPINKRLWIATQHGFIYWMYYEPLSSMPIYNDNQTWAPYGWAETDWYTGDLIDVIKDWESVTVYGENITAARPVKIYYRDSDTAVWKLLGTVTDNEEELRWLVSSYRPASNKIKLGILMQTNSRTETPIIRAIVTKYAPMLTDRWRWQCSIVVKDNQETLTGMQSYTAAQQRTHLTSMVTSVPPVILEDLWGDQWEARIIGCTRQAEEYGVKASAQEIFDVWSMTLEQATGNV